VKPIDIKPGDMDIVRGILARHVPEREVRAFGSRVSWTANEFSDLDLTVMGDEPLSLSVLADIKEEFENSDLPIKVDVVDWAVTKENFRKIIEKEFVVIQNGGKKSRGMAGKWTDTVWGNLATLEYGKSLCDYGGTTGKYRVFGTNGPIGWHDTPLCNRPGIIIGRKGAYRGVHYSPAPFYVIDTAFYLKPKVELDTKWAYYQLLKQDINGMDSGSAIPSTSRDDFYGLSVRVPPLPEQKAIAHILGTLDDKIELNRRMNETLEQMARALFKHWFVDFEFPNSAGKPYKSSGGKMIDSELGKIPKGWAAKPLSELCILGRGSSPRPINDFMNGEVPWVKIADATASIGPFLFETKEKLKAEGVANSVSVAPGDLILSNSATCGVPIFVEVHGCIHDGWLYFKNLKLISKIYLYHVLIELSEHLIHIADGSVQKNLNIELVGKQPVLVPPVTVMDAFNRQANVLFERIRQNGFAIRNFAAIRDALLPKLLSGEIRINDTEKLLKETL
jgi:type I restriction enzyme S subunit